MLASRKRRGQGPQRHDRPCRFSLDDAAAITYLTMLYTQMRDLDQRLANIGGFPGGNWPHPVSDLSNGRVHDGGTTLDWNIKT